METSFKKEALNLKEELISNRRDLHMHPELSFNEFDTCKKIKEYLTKLGIELQNGIPEPSVVGILWGKNKSGKTIALRADIDALPINESNDVPYKSQNPGVMHACGHDSHIAALFGACKLLSAHKDELNGNVKFIFQTAEETPPGGAKILIESGVLENPHVDAIIGEHVQSHVEVGKMAFKSGAFMAATDTFKVVIKGKGGHGGHFHKAVDSIVIAAQIIQAVQTISSRKVSPMDPMGLSICMIHGGDKENIIPDNVELRGTIRTFDKKVREYIINEFERTVKYITELNNIGYSFQINEGYPAVINDKAFTEFAKRIASDIVGIDNVIDYEHPTMGGEDFSRYLNLVPGVFANLGGGNVQKGICAPIHNSRFDVDEDCLPIGAAFLAHAADEYLNNGI